MNSYWKYYPDKYVQRWKAVQLHPHASPKSPHPMVEIQENEVPVTTIFSVCELDGHDIVLWKSNALGVRKPLYRIINANEDFSRRHKYTLRWFADK